MADIYTAALMEHNAHPDYRYVMDAPTHTREGVNPSCGDALELALRIEDGTIAEAAFTGHGCAVSQASADIMADLIEGEPVEAARHRCELFLSMIRGDVVFVVVQRKRCACAGAGPDRIEQGLRAMIARAHGHAFVIEDARDIVGVHAAHVERKRAVAHARIVRSDDVDEAELREHVDA